MQPEHVNTIIQGASAIQIIILTFIGCIFVVALFAGINWVMSIRLRGIDDLLPSINELNIKIEKINSSVWSETELNEKIDNHILRHEHLCCKNQKQG